MTRSVSIAVLACALLMAAPLTAAAQDDLDDLMASDPESAGKADEGGGDEGGDEGDAEKPPADEDEWDENAMDEERPPGDPTAFKDPEEKEEGPPPEPEGEPNPLSVGLTIGYGILVSDGEVNPWTLGFGLLGGYDLGLINIGVRVGYYIGETVEIQRASFSISGGGTDEVSASLFELGVEAGLDIEAGEDVLIRPGLGFGLATVSGGDSSETNPFIAPGVAVLFNLSPTVYMGLDSRYQLIASDSESVGGLVFLFNLGMRF